MTRLLSPRCLGVLLLALPGLALAACTSDPPAADGPSAPASVASAPGTPAPASSAPPTAAPVPADGTNVRSCGDGSCEVEVSAETEVPLPARSGLGPIAVIAVDDTNVSMVIPLTGSDFDSDGGCEPFITGPGAGSGGFVTMSCAQGDRSTINKVTLEVLHVAGGAAVLRIQPAS